MKRIAFASAASLLLGTCLFLTGCGQSSTGGDKMGSGDHKMSTMDKMDDRMSGKMTDGKMTDGKMTAGKMAGK